MCRHGYVELERGLATSKIAETSERTRRTCVSAKEGLNFKGDIYESRCTSFAQLGGRSSASRPTIYLTTCRPACRSAHRRQQQRARPKAWARRLEKIDDRLETLGYSTPPPRKRYITLNEVGWGVILLRGLRPSIHR